MGGLLRDPDERPPLPTPFYSDDRVTVHHGDCLDVLRTLPDCSVDSVVTDPPSGIAFMGKEWDTDKGGRDAWVAWLASVLAECRRILKPGGHALVWALPRTSGWTHRAIEDAGMDVRDCITHLFGSGFPKSLDVGKAIDRQRCDDATHITAYLRQQRGTRPLGEIVKGLGFAGTQGTHGVAAFFSEDPSKARVPSLAHWEALRALLGFGSEMDMEVARLNARKGTPSEDYLTRPAADYDSRPGMAESWSDGKGWTGSLARGGDPVREDAARWDGWGTALKPSSEMWYLARRPLTGTVAQTVLAHGTGALNIAATRVRHASAADLAVSQAKNQHAAHGNGARINNVLGDMSQNERADYDGAAGRWPSNVVLTHSPTDPEDGCEPSCPVAELDAQSGNLTSGGVVRNNSPLAGDIYGQQTRRSGLGYTDAGGASRFFPTFRYQAKAPTRERPKVDGVAHPTCKPLALMRWLARLVTPPGGTILDPFAGSGTTAEAAILEGFRCITIEREAEYLPLILERIRR